LDERRRMDEEKAPFFALAQQPSFVERRNVGEYRPEF
jgi:hypothetical protein